MEDPEATAGEVIESERGEDWNTDGVGVPTATEIEVADERSELEGESMKAKTSSDDGAVSSEECVWAVEREGTRVDARRAEAVFAAARGRGARLSGEAGVELLWESE